MTLGKKKIFSLLLGFGILTNVLELAHVNFFSTTTLISFCTYIILPGLLISLILRIKKISFWENLIISIGLSIAFLEFGGLLLNILLPLMGVNDPLAFKNTVVGFGIYLVLLFICAWLRTEQLVIEIPGQSRRAARSGPTTSFRPNLPASPGFTPILEQPYRISESDPTTPPRLDRFAKPGFTPILEQPYRISESDPTTPTGLDRLARLPTLPLPNESHPLSGSGPTTPSGSGQFLKPGPTSIPGQSNPVSVSGLPTAPLGSGQFLKPGPTPIPGQSNPVSISGLTTAPLGSGQFLKPGPTSIAGQSNPTSVSGLTTAPLGSGQFLKPSPTSIPGQSNPVSVSGLTTAPLGSGQLLKPAFMETPSKVPKNIEAKPSFTDTQNRVMADIDTMIFSAIQLPEPSKSAANRAFADIDTLVSTAIQLPKHSNIEKALYALPIAFPILSILGTIVLNNGGSNTLTLTLFGTIAVYSLLLVLCRNKIGVNIYPYALFFMGAACLFTTSLRSWYITGHDIETEFYVFQQTKIHNIWDMAFYHDPYNACLSITILPTVLTNVLSIQDMYVYKVIIQLIFATAPVLVFFLIKNYTTPIFAFLSAFIFISFPTFFVDMPMLNRQEIAFLFFGLGLYVMLHSNLPLVTRRSLFTVFALGTIVSHYSTNFVLLASITFVYILMFIVSAPLVRKILASLLPKARRAEIIFPRKAFLSLPMILILLATTFFWNTIYTNSSEHSASVLVKLGSSLFPQSNNHLAAIDVSYNFLSPTKPSPKQMLQEYIQRTVQSLQENEAAKNQFYSTSITSKYPTHLVSQKLLAPTPLGNWLSSSHIPVFSIYEALARFIPDFIHVFVFIGPLTLSFSKQKKRVDLQYLLLCSGAVVLLIVMIMVPGLSVDYGELRMLQQFLFISSLPIVLILSSVLFFVKEPKRIVFAGIIASLLFLNSTGFISHLTGNYYAEINLDNAGSYYDAYYVHKSDVVAIEWLANNNTEHELVETDRRNAIKLLAYGDIDALYDFFPAAIPKNAYVYLVSSDRVVAVVGTESLGYNPPENFLDDNKDLIYNNGKNKIYK